MKILNSPTINFFFKNKQSFFFIAVNVFVALLGFIRSFAFMKFFDFTELGLITLVNTSVMLVGFFQLGLINGAYRIIALQESESNIRVNNVMFSYFTLLFFALVAISSIGFMLSFFNDFLLIVLVITIGILSLVTNWITNNLIGSREYRKLNIANFLSAFASLFCLVFAYFYGVWGAIISLLIQPLLFIIIIFLTNKIVIPIKFELELKYLRYILNFGFVPFLSGIFVLIYVQIERWSINFFLGSESLGKMYLVFLIIVLWILIPISINNLFFPKAVLLFKNKELFLLHKLINKYFLIILLYSLIGIILILTLLHPLVSIFFPNHLPYVYLVFIALPGLILRSLCDPVSLYLNSIVKLKIIFWSDLLSITAYLISILGFALLKKFNLENVLICFVLYNLVKFIYLIYFYNALKKSL